MKNVFSKPPGPASPWDRKWLVATLAGVVLLALFLLPGAFGGGSDAVSSKVRGTRDHAARRLAGRWRAVSASLVARHVSSSASSALCWRQPGAAAWLEVAATSWPLASALPQWTARGTRLGARRGCSHT